MDYDAIREGMADAIPFNRHLGLEVRELGDGHAVVDLPDESSLRNHVGSQHAGALFSAGEAASGGAFVGAFAEHLARLTPLAESADIAYKRIARGPITATARLGEDAGELLAALERDGRVRFPVEVELTDGDGELVAEMVVRWYVRPRADAPA